MQPKNSSSELAELCRLIDQLPRPFDLAYNDPAIQQLGPGQRSREYRPLAEKLIDRLTNEKQPYAIDRAQRHLERCARCGRRFPAGHLAIVSPASSQQIDLSYVALHSMKEHDSPSYAGSEREGSIDVDLLSKVVKTPDNGIAPEGYR